MPGPYYRTLRATMAAAVNTAVPIVLDAEGNTKPGILLPKDVSKITDIFVSIGASIVAVASAGVTLTLRLSGDGLVAQQDVTIGSLREDTTSTGGAKMTPPYDIPVDIPVIAGNTVNLAAFMGGVDPGSPEVCVTLKLV